ncbi:MAG TPA: transketolase [Wenzhouxiangellaceae bacterium]|nr:transketolase [Wenzhouxiangellaceae bacterium]
MTDRRHLANAIRALAMDAVQRASSGHPGMPMGMADIAEVLFNDFHRHNPGNPDWPDRDRFVVSNGHGSMLLYAVLHLTGYALSIEDLKNFRQLHSPTPGHPEYGEAPGVETTTGPLGQGLANGVGMALAEKLLARQFNRDGLEIVDHYTWVFAGDGCLMEGVSHEACSLAGTWGLGKLVVFYDDNGISIDGEVRGWFTDDTPGRFRSYGWQVIEDVDGHDAAAVRATIEEARLDKHHPTLICCKTTIGFGAPNKQGTADTHGAPLGDEEIAAARTELGWPHPAFEIPDDVRAGWDARERGQDLEAKWGATWKQYAKRFPKLASEFERRIKHELPDDFAARARAIIEKLQADDSKVATRKASALSLEDFGPLLPELLGGSADLTGSNNTNWSGSRDIMDADSDGNYIYYGVREFGMTAIANGLHLHGGFIPYTGTFLVFSDYARNAVRMSALIPTGVIHVYTHDSIGLGEDGPTHQPIEHVASLRMIPNLEVWRPADKTETAAAWADAIERRNGPTALVLTRQGVTHQPRDAAQLAGIRRGGYILRDTDDATDLVLIATGSEVELAMNAAEALSQRGIAARVVSMPNPGRFLAQTSEYRTSVLPKNVSARIAIEAGVTAYWHRFVGPDGAIVGIDRFGASAPASTLFDELGFDVAAVVDRALRLVGNGER